MNMLFRILTLLMLVWLPAAFATISQECRDFAVDDTPGKIPTQFVDGLLWKVSRNDQPASYIFGTIHVSDPRVLNIPEPVITAMEHSSHFAMEALPEMDSLLTLRESMFFSDDSRLSDLLDEQNFRRAVDILHNYNMSEESVTRMKPWAAYLTMNYPSSNSIPLDMVLLEIARQRDMQILGLESITEQLSALTSLTDRQQVRILVDTLCNYDLVLHGFEEMIALYLDRNLKGLHVFSQKYSFPQDDLYDDLYRKLLIDRNHLMVKRLDGLLNEGSAFVAIGAMHLAGQEGVLALLDRAGYTIEAVY